MRFLFLAALLGSLFSAGCGKSKYPVTGSIQVEGGAPLVGGRIHLHPKDVPGDKAPVSCLGEIKDGKFVVGTHSLTDGVYPGVYKVTVDPPSYNADRKKPKDFPDFDKRYTRPKETPLEFTVESKANEWPTIVLKKKL